MRGKYACNAKQTYYQAGFDCTHSLQAYLHTFTINPKRKPQLTFEDLARPDLGTY